MDMYLTKSRKAMEYWGKFLGGNKGTKMTG